MTDRAVAASSTHPLAGPVYTVPPTPKSCGVCNRGEHFLRRIYGTHDSLECSHVQCPHRNRITAQPRA